MTPIIEESGANIIFIEVAYTCWSGDRKQNLFAILIYRGSRKKQVTAVTIAIQTFCGIIAYDADAAGTTWKGRGRGEEITCEQEDL